MSIETALAGLETSAPSGLAEGVALGIGLAEGFDLYPSPIGDVIVTFGTEGVISLAPAGTELPAIGEKTGLPLIRAEAPRAWGRYIPEAIEAGRPGKVPVDLRRLSLFHREVLQATWSIPRGEVRPYGWVAGELGKPGAVRAVGTALARNPIPLMIPCHRVVRSDGTIGEYSMGGPEVKTRLLDHEGAEPGRLSRLAGSGVRVQGNTSTRVFCHPTCRSVRRSSSSNVVDFHSAAAAEEAGYRACLLCRPG
jgi:O-6-methylguanine DNA methyltransferase